MMKSTEEFMKIVDNSIKESQKLRTKIFHITLSIIIPIIEILVIIFVKQTTIKCAAFGIATLSLLIFKYIIDGKAYGKNLKYIDYKTMINDEVKGTMKEKFKSCDENIVKMLRSDIENEMKREETRFDNLINSIWKACSVFIVAPISFLLGNVVSDVDSSEIIEGLITFILLIAAIQKKFIETAKLSILY